MHRRLDLKAYPPGEYAYALLYFTGSDHFVRRARPSNPGTSRGPRNRLLTRSGARVPGQNRSMRHFCKAKGYSLSDHGLVKAVKVGSNNVVRGTINEVPARTEQDIFTALGLQFKEPHERNCEVKPKGGGEGVMRVC